MAEFFVGALIGAAACYAYFHFNSKESKRPDAE